MHIECLTIPPVSGSIEEVRFDAIGECCWFKFTQCGEEWSGVFGKPPTPINIQSATAFNNERSIFVIAAGQGYLLDTASRSLLHKTRNSYLQAAIAVPDTEYVVVCDNKCLELYDTRERIWKSNDIATDGIRLISATENAVKGYIWQSDRWYEFFYDAKARIVSTGEWFAENSANDDSAII